MVPSSYRELKMIKDKKPGINLWHGIYTNSITGVRYISPFWSLSIKLKLFYKNCQNTWLPVQASETIYFGWEPNGKQNQFKISHCYSQIFKNFN